LGTAVFYYKIGRLCCCLR